MTVYINGVSGTVGSYLYESFVNLGEFSVQGLSSSRTSRMMHLDLRDPCNFNYSVFEESDFFIFSASYSNYNLCEKNPNYAFEINVDGTKHVIERLLERNVRVLFVSSCAVYGNSDVPCREESDLNGQSVYANTKKIIESEFLGHRLFKVFRLSNVVCRTDNMKKFFKNCESNGLVAEIFSGFIFSIIGGCDLYSIISYALKHWNETPPVLNVGSGELVSKEQIAELYKRVANSSFLYKVIPPSVSYMLGRDCRVPLDISRLLKFYPAQLTPLEKVIRVEYADV